MPFALDDPDACTRLSVTVTPGIGADIADQVGEVACRCLGEARRHDIVLAVHDVLDAFATAGRVGPVNVRVRRRDDRTEVVLVDHDPAARPGDLGTLSSVRTRADELREERTDAGRRIVLTYRSA